jgi:hypothetical protein
MGPVFTSQKYAGAQKPTRPYLSDHADLIDPVEVRIPRDLLDEITVTLHGKGFSTVDDFVVYVLRVAMGKQAQELQEAEDTKVVSDRLRKLGYI